ncbi:hypothetical protein HG66A1_61060 [Gimesia chilikensis]|uniref:Prenyltransferase n=1 Tax=Gimesia chilikensis TaxID=2605989 RepID=A0A517PY59_9PLAN|nr:hypothetical protein HG66A1_61060 [Gimesia chilikensis]
MLSKIITSLDRFSHPDELTYEGQNTLSLTGSIRHLPKKALLLINSLSLDAPLVAITWLWCFSRIYNCSVIPAHYYILFSVTWLAYSGDRLLDTLRTPGSIRNTPRHRFTSQHFILLLGLWLLIATFSVCFLLVAINSTELKWGFCLLSVLVLYFASCYCFPHLARRFLPREFLVGIFFSIAIHFFIVVQQAAWTPYYFWTGFSFFAICTLNCLAISRWEFTSDLEAREVTFFTSSPARLQQFHYLLFVFLILQSVISVLMMWKQQIPAFELSLLLSTLLLIGLDRGTVSSRLKPVLADLALLTPWLILSIVS